MSTNTHTSHTFTFISVCLLFLTAHVVSLHLRHRHLPPSVSLHLRHRHLPPSVSVNTYRHHLPPPPTDILKRSQLICRSGTRRCRRLTCRRRCRRRRRRLRARSHSTRSAAVAATRRRSCQRRRRRRRSGCARALATSAPTYIPLKVSLC